MNRFGCLGYRALLTRLPVETGMPFGLDDEVTASSCDRAQAACRDPVREEGGVRADTTDEV